MDGKLVIARIPALDRLFFAGAKQEQQGEKEQCFFHECVHRGMSNINKSRPRTEMQRIAQAAGESEEQEGEVGSLESGV